MKDAMKHYFDAASIGTAVATLAGWLPHIAALLSIIWTCLRIYETRTVQGWIEKGEGQPE